MSGNAFLDLLIFAIPIALATLWWTSSRARELAISHSRIAGSSCFSRVYEFEFTDQGEYRDKAMITMNGHVVQNIYFPYTRDAEGNRIYVN